MSAQPDNFERLYGGIEAGGTIYQLAHKGLRPIVMTIFGGDRPDNAPLSDFARGLHARWQLGTAAAMTRRDEDRAALDRLQAGLIHLPFPDAIYRIDPVVRKPLYYSEETLFGMVYDTEMIDRVARTLRARIASAVGAESPLQVVAPLAAGHHVDHQIVRAAAERLDHMLIYFEDYPYAEDEAQLAQARDGDEWSSGTVPLSEADLAAKIEAFLQHRSQLSTFYSGEAEAAQRIRAYALHAGGGQAAERYWYKPRR